MLLEHLGLHQCQGKYGQPVRSTGRIPFEGASVMVPPIAKPTCTCRHRWNSNPTEGPFVNGRLSHTCTCQCRGKHWDHSKGAGVPQQWYKGLFAKRNVLVQRSEGGQLPRHGQQYPDVKGLQPAPTRRQDMRLDMAFFAWEHMMHEQAAYHWNAYKLQCF